MKSNKSKSTRKSASKGNARFHSNSRHSDNCFEDNGSKSRGNSKGNKGYEPKVYNDAAWYRRNPEALEAATKLSMNLAAGQPIYPFLRNYVPEEFKQFETNNGFPGVVKFEYVTSLGAASASTDAINLASQRLFKDLRKQNTGSTAYDPVDLMLYILAMDQIFSLYAWMVRAYKTVNYYSSRNRNVPKVLLKAMNLDPTIGQELANFRYWLINFKARLDTWNVPGNIDFIKRHYWLNSHVYKDQDTSKAALFFFDQRFWLRWTENINEDETRNFSLNPAYLLGTGQDGTLTFTDMAVLMTDMLRDIETSQDLSIINGDILKVFSESECFRVSIPADTEIITPYYDEEVAQQVRNSILCGYPLNEDRLVNGRIYQDYERGVIVQDLKVSPRIADLNPLVTFNNEVPSSDDIMISTRFLPYVEYDGTTPGSEFGRIRSAGSDILTALTVYRYDATTGNITASASTTSVVSSVGGSVAEASTQIAVYPVYYVTDSSATNLTSHFHPIKSVIGDVNNYTVLGPAQLRNLHETAMFSLFNVY